MSLFRKDTRTNEELLTDLAREEAELKERLEVEKKKKEVLKLKDELKRTKGSAFNFDFNI